MEINLIHARLCLFYCLHTRLGVLMIISVLIIAIRYFVQRAQETYLSFDLWYSPNNLPEFSSPQIVLALE